MPASLTSPALAENSTSRLLQRVGLALGGVLALAFAIVMPPLQIPDEDGHFVRAYLISRGEFVGRGAPRLPAPIVAFVMRYPEDGENFEKFSPRALMRDLTSRPENMQEAGPPLANRDGRHKWLAWSTISSSLYCPIVYLPASLGILTAQTFGASPLLMMYCARILNAFVFIAALAVSFRLAPAYRGLVTVIALMPMTLHQAGGISADVVTIALSFIGVGLVLYGRQHLITRRFLILVALVFVSWSLSKSSIWALPLLALLPMSGFRSRLNWLAYIGAVSGCMVGALLIWNGITSHNMDAFRAIRLTQGIDISANVRLVIAHPLSFAGHLLGMMLVNLKLEVGQFIGAFGWTKFNLPLWAKSLYLLLILLVAAMERSPKPFRIWERGVLVLVFVAGVVFVHAAMAVSDTTLCGGTLRSLCADLYTGVQGRYLIPFCLAGLLALRQTRITLPQVTVLRVVMAVGTLHALASLALILSTYYL
jgi:uncharacterized membrane protein